MKRHYHWIVVFCKKILLYGVGSFFIFSTASLQAQNKKCKDLFTPKASTKSKAAVKLKASEPRQTSTKLKVAVKPKNSTKSKTPVNSKADSLKALKAEQKPTRARKQPIQARKKALKNSQLAVAELLKEESLDNINAVDSRGYSGLMRVIEKGAPIFAQQLIEKGADIHIAGSNGETALKLAVEQIFPSLVQLLIEKREIDLKTSDSYSEMSLILAMEQAFPNLSKHLVKISDSIHDLDLEVDWILAMDNDFQFHSALLGSGAEIYFSDSDLDLILVIDKGYQVFTEIPKTDHDTHDMDLRRELNAKLQSYKALIELLIERGAKAKTAQNYNINFYSLNRL